MPESITTILVSEGESFIWQLRRIPHDEPFIIAQTIDRNIGFTGRPEDLTRFAESLRIAVETYLSMSVSKEGTQPT